MSIMDKFKRNKPDNPVKESTKAPVISMPHRLRLNATGLEAHYGRTGFVERIKAAADTIEEMETALTEIIMTSKDPASIKAATEALDACDKLRK